MADDVEMQLMTHSNGNYGAAHSANEQHPESNGEPCLLDSVETQRTVRNDYQHRQTSVVCKIKRELEKPVCWRVRVWMILAIIPFIIVAVVLISMAVCAALYEDVDDKFDSSLFTNPMYFNGSVGLPNMAFTEELLDPSSNESSALTDELAGKLTDLYTSSPALGRYFSKAEISSFGNDPVVADFQLTFLLPEERHDELLRNFTLSREMVYNVLRQFLYDQRAFRSSPTYMDPGSLKLLRGLQR